MRDKLRAAQADRLDELFDADYAQYRAKVDTLVASGRNTLGIATEIVAIVERAEIERKRSRARSHMPPPPMPTALAALSAGGLAALEKVPRSAPSRIASPPVPAPAPRPVAPQPKVVAMAPSKPPAPERKLIIEPAGEGLVRVRVQRSGYEAKGRQWAQGDIVALPAEIARSAILNGAADAYDDEET